MSELPDVDVAGGEGLGGGSGAEKKQNRDYCITKSTLLTEMKTMAKYDRKVLEMGSKAFMSFLKVLLYCMVVYFIAVYCIVLYCIVT